MTPLDHALAYAARRWHVFPVVPGEKRPATLNGLNDATVDEAQIRRWWGRAGWENHSIGIRTGEISGIWVLDVDVANGKRGAESLRALCDQYGLLPQSFRVDTPSEGLHIYFTWPPDGADIRNNASGRLGDGLDVRGNGGYVVAAPSAGPTPSTSYEAHDFDADTEPAPAWLLDLVRQAAPVVRTPGPRLPRASDADLGPADRFNDSTCWDELLTRDGWTLASTLTDGEQRWVRPGKEARDGISATVGHEGRDILTVFTSSVPGLEPERSYSRFQYEAAMRHGGDWSACASAVVAQERRDSGDDWLDNVRLPAGTTSTVAELDAVRLQPKGEDADEPWPDPTPVDNGVTHGPPFPTEVLPSWMAQQVEEVAEVLQVPEDLPAIVGLGALATLAAGHVRVRAAGWNEHVNLYLVAAMAPGTGKSPAFKKMMAPVEELERTRMRQVRDDVVRAETRKVLYEKRAKAAQERAVKGEGSPDEAVSLMMEAEGIEVPPSGQMLCDDITPEALVELLARSNGRMAIVSSEGGVFDIMAGQYASPGKAANLNVYLQGFSGDTVKRERISGVAVTVPEALLTIAVTTQPSVVVSLARNQEMVGRGLPIRFMYALPASNIGYRDRLANRSVDEDVDAEYQTRMSDLGRRWAGWGMPVTLDLSPGALDRFLNWDHALEQMLRNGQPLAGMAEWSSKLRSVVLRLCGLLHLADGGRHDQQIHLDVLERALLLADYFIAHARIVHDVWGRSSTVSGVACRVLDRAVARRWWRTPFTVRDAHIEVRKAREFEDTTAEGVRDGLLELVELGWCRAIGDPDAPIGRGRPSPQFMLRSDAEEWMERHATGNMGTPHLLSLFSHSSVPHVQHVRIEAKKDLSLSLTSSTATSTTHPHAAHAAHLTNPQPVVETIDPTDSLFG